MRSFFFLVAALCSFCWLATQGGAQAQVVINEIQYHPVEKEHFDAAGNSTYSDTNQPANLADDVHEFVELLNAGPTPVDLTGWSFSSGIEYLFPANTSIQPGGFLVIGKVPARIASVYGLAGGSVLGPFLNGSKLSNGGDTLTLKDGSGNVVDSVTYQSGFPWAISANALGASDDFTGLNSTTYQYKGRSLQRVSPAASSNDPANWIAVRPAIGTTTFADLPTPGAANLVTRAVPKPVVTAYAALQTTDNAPIIRATIPVSVTCTFSGSDSLSGVQVEYFIDDMNNFGETRTLVDMTALGNGQYKATIPGQSVSRSIVRYRIRANRGDGSEVVAPRADDPAVVPVGPPSYLSTPAPPNAAAKIAGTREAWFAYFITPARTSTKPIIDLIVSTDGSVVDDTATNNTVQFNGRNGFQAMAFDCKGSPKRATAQNTSSAYPRETPYVLASDRIWEDTVPAVFVSNGVIRDAQVRFHRSRWNRNPSSKSFKVFFPDYAPYTDVAGTNVTSIFETNHDDTTLVSHGLHTLAGLPVTPLRWVDWYFNNDGAIQRLEQGEYEGEFLKSYFDKLHRLNPSAPTEDVGEYYKSSGYFIGGSSDNTLGEGPYGNGNEWKLPAAGFWTELQRFSYTYGLQNHGWVGPAPIRNLINGMWTARGDTHISPNPNIANLRTWFNANWDVDTELTALSLSNWLTPWDDTTQNHFLYHRANGKWFRVQWDFDSMFGSGDNTGSGSSLYLGEVGLPSVYPGNNSRGPNYVKDSFIKAFRQEFNQRFWFQNNTLLDPENLQTITYANSSGTTRSYFDWIQSVNSGQTGTNFAVGRFNYVNSVATFNGTLLGVFYKPVRPTAVSPASAAAVLPGANLVSSAYAYNATYTHASAPTVSPHASSKWEIRSATSTYDYPVYIATSTTNKTSLPIPFDQLAFGQTYYWRVTYYATDGHPSITSAERSFSYGPTSTVAGAVSLNEVMAENHAAVQNGTSFPDYIELKNNTGSPIDITGWGLTDDDFNLTKYVFPGGTTIAAGGYLLVWCDSNSTAPGLHSGFALDRDGQRVLLTQAGAVKDLVTFGPQAVDLSIGRIADGTGAWTLTNPTPNAANVAHTPLGSVSTLKFNEWMAAPTYGEDWFEVYNPDPNPVALAGLYLSGSPGTPKNTQIPPLSFIAGNGFTKFVADGTTQGFNHADFRLSAGGDNLILTNTAGTTTITSVSFGLQAADVSQGRLLDGSSNIVSFPGSSSPGAGNWVLSSLVINEALTNSTAPFEDAIEIYNPGTTAVDLGGWWLSDDKSAPLKYHVPAGTSITAGGYLVFYENQFNPAPGSATSFSLSSLGDEIILSAVDGTGTLTGVRAQVSFGAAPENVSFGRIPTAGGSSEFWPLAAHTFGQDSPADTATFRTGLGAPNAAPRTGPIIINEIMYHPPDFSGAVDNSRDEFIELHNITTNPVDVSGWILRGDSDFVFPAGSTISPGDYVLLVAFDPVADATSLAAFKSAYSLNSHVVLFGPYTNKLSNSTQSLELAYPGVPVGTVTPYLLADKVVYEDAAPWSPAADGTGPSLQRLSRTSIGNDAANWTAAAPTPGNVNYGESPITDSDGDGLPDAWEIANGLNPHDATDASQDADGDGQSNMAEYFAGTNPRSGADWFGSDVVRLDNGAGYTIRFIARANKSYTVLFSPSLSNPTWQPLPNGTLAAQPTDYSASITDPAAPAQRFYRVVTPSQP